MKTIATQYSFLWIIWSHVALYFIFSLLWNILWALRKDIRARLDLYCIPIRVSWIPRRRDDWSLWSTHGYWVPSDDCAFIYSCHSCIMYTRSFTSSCFAFFLNLPPLYPPLNQYLVVRPTVILKSNSCKVLGNSKLALVLYMLVTIRFVCPWSWWITSPVTM